ncbi:MAG: ATP-binding protein [Anaerolineales bacterium]
MAVQDAQDAQAELDWLRELVYQRSKLVEISLTLNSTLEPDRLPQLIIKMATDLLNSEGASILLLDENTHDLYFAAATGGDPKELRNIPVPMEGSIAGTIYRKNEPLIINEVAKDPRHFQQVDAKTQLETRSLIGVPMTIRNEVIGVLEALNKRGGEFAEDDVRTLEIIASTAAVAINNARLLDALKRAYEELGRLDRMKTDFIAIASHELRTPLGVILGYAALLQEEAGGESSEHAETVLNQALRMRSLIEDMTNINTMKVGSKELDLQEQPLQDPARMAQEEVSDLIQAKGQVLTSNIPPDPLVARFDAPKVTMALINLLNNAMRFTPAKGEIRLDVEKHGSEGWLRVVDTGMGIPEDQVDKIFDQFYQVENHMTRRHEGMGLGLSIVRAIADAHGGRVWAESPGPDKGATFTIALPLS